MSARGGQVCLHHLNGSLFYDLLAFLSPHFLLGGSSPEELLTWGRGLLSSGVALGFCHARTAPSLFVAILTPPSPEVTALSVLRAPRQRRHSSWLPLTEERAASLSPPPQTS